MAGQALPYDNSEPLIHHEEHEDTKDTKKGHEQQVLIFVTFGSFVIQSGPAEGVGFSEGS